MVNSWKEGFINIFELTDMKHLKVTEEMGSFKFGTQSREYL
jgi:hypothetical protein